MEIKEGYKQTDVGVIPADWQVSNIANFNPFITSGSRGWARFYSDMGDPFLRITNMSRNVIQIDLSDLKLVNLPSRENEGKRTQLQIGDILISITADVGIVSYVDRTIPRPAYISQHVALVRFDDNNLNSLFLAYFLASINAQRNFASTTDGGAKAGMSLLGIGKIAILKLPTYQEQTAIATVLSDTDALISCLETLIEKKRAIKQGAMQQLLKPKEGWVVKKLGEISSIKTGPFGSTLHEKDYVEDGTPIITVEHLGELGIVHEDIPMVSDFDRKRLSAYSLQSDDIVFSRVGSVDRNSIVSQKEEGWLFSGRLLRIRLNGTSVIPKYLSYYFHLESTKQRIRSVAVGQTMPSLNTQILSRIDIFLPDSTTEQKRIAQILSDMDAEIAGLEQKLEKCKVVKQGMMQELLMGKTRLV